MTMSESIEIVELGVSKGSEMSETRCPSSARPLPSGWKYKSIRVGRLQLPYYASPHTQLLLVALICFLLPGAYNALCGLGGGGQIDSHDFDNAQMGLYSTFAVLAFFSGTVVNRLGVRYPLVGGGIGYALFAGAQLCYKHSKNGAFVVASGCFLGGSASLLWAAQGLIMVSYPPEGQRGRYISWFWSFFNLGAVIGCLPALALNIHSNEAVPASDATYTTFISLMCVGTMIGFLMVEAKDVVRADGTQVHLARHPTWKSELLGLWTTLLTDSYVVLLVPMFFASNIFYTYQFNGVNQAHFNLRTRSLNNLLYWIMQILGAMAFGYAIDFAKYKRTVKAKMAWAVLIVLTLGIWGGGYAWEMNEPDRVNENSPPLPTMDWTSKNYAGLMLMYMSYGFYDAVWQSSVYWYLGALSNSGRTSANFTGFYKAFQSAGAAIIWRIDAVGTPFRTEFLITWLILAGALVFAAPVIFRVIKDADEDNFYAESIEDGQDAEVHDPADDTSHKEVLETHHPGPPTSTAVPQRHLQIHVRMVPRDELAVSNLYHSDSEPLKSSAMTLEEALRATENEAFPHKTYSASEPCRQALK